MLFLMVLSVCMAYLTAWMAQRKGYSFLPTFLVSLITWWATFPIFLFNKPASEQPTKIPTDAARQRLGSHRRCSVCNRPNTINAVVCRWCGVPFSIVNNPKTAVETMFLTDDVREEVNEGRIRVCQRCGRLNNPKRSVCKSCGAEFAVQEI